MTKKLLFIICVFIQGIVLGQITKYSTEFSTYSGLAVFNNNPSLGFSFGNSLIIHNVKNKIFFETSIRYTFASDIQKEQSKPTYTAGYTDADPKFNSVVSTVDLFQNIGFDFLNREKVILSLTGGLGIRKWSDVRNGDIVITEMVDANWGPNWKIRDAFTVYNKIWQLGGNIGCKVEMLPSNKFSFGYKTQYYCYKENNSWFNELYFIIKISKLK